MLKILNPFIWFINVMRYFGHIEFYREVNIEYEPYDFSQDLKYF